jgi:hypothetical protein
VDNETVDMIQNCRLFRTSFGDSQLFVTHMQKDTTLCRCDLWMTDVESNGGFLPQTTNQSAVRNRQLLQSAVRLQQFLKSAVSLQQFSQSAVSLQHSGK